MQIKPMIVRRDDNCWMIMASKVRFNIVRRVIVH